MRILGFLDGLVLAVRRGREGLGAGGGRRGVWCGWRDFWGAGGGGREGLGIILGCWEGNGFGWRGWGGGRFGVSKVCMR